MRRRVVWGEGVMVGGLGRRCFWLADVKWLRVFGRDTMQCSARHVVCFECACGKGLRSCLAWAKKRMFAGMSVREFVVRCRLFALYVHVVWWVW
jgi:hypothetical protein